MCCFRVAFLRRDVLPQPCPPDTGPRFNTCKRRNFGSLLPGLPNRQQIVKKPSYPLILLLAMLGYVGDLPCLVQAAHSPGGPHSFKRVDLERKYSIEIPDNFSPQRIPANVAAVPIYRLDAQTTIEVEILPYSGLVPVDAETGKLVPPATGDLLCELSDSPPDPTKLAVDAGPPLTRYFKIQEDRDVYYGCAVIDNAYECTSHSACPHPVAPATRYTATYAFAVFDKPKQLIIQFTGSHDGPSKRITRFEGDGKLLRDRIVPSLRSTP